ncbi:MAG TPA: 2-methylcitrate dehydratase, partial [Geobacteraceae bacterium]|nr:2-methylcitrate dehydratase [Geobacteraceae bacterium]
QYMTAVALLYGELTADHYSDEIAADPCIDELRTKIEVIEEPRYSRDYLDQEKRSIANAVQVFFTDGSHTEKIEMEYPLGHPRRREEALPLLVKKCRENLTVRFSREQAAEFIDLCLDGERLERMAVNEFMEMLVV